jgi:hypothetical protein
MEELFHGVKAFSGLEGSLKAIKNNESIESAVGGEAGSGWRASETDGIRRCSRIADAETGDYGHACDAAPVDAALLPRTGN